MSIQDCVERLGLQLPSASKCYRYYNVTVLEVAHISDVRVINKLKLGVKTKSVYKVKIKIQVTGQPRGLFKKLFGEEFENVYLGQFNYGRNSSTLCHTQCPLIWYKVNHEVAERLVANQSKYATKHKQNKQ
jgi:hypothetical protein